MKNTLFAVSAMVAACGVLPTAAPAQERTVIAVPGFANFAEIDGTNVWINNDERVEYWSTKGKIATIIMSSPCGSLLVQRPTLWAAECKDGTLHRIDIPTLKTVATIHTGIANPRGEFNVTAGAGSIWIPSDEKGEISRIDPATNTVTATIKVDPGTYYLAYGFGSLWAASSRNNSLQRIDPRTNKVVKRTVMGKEPGFIAAGEGGVWVQEQGAGTVARVDPITGEVSGRVKVGNTLKWGEVSVGGGKVWLRTTEDQMFVVIDPKTLAIRTRVGKQVGSGALRYSDAGLWTTEHDIQTMTWWPHPEKIGN